MCYDGSHAIPNENSTKREIWYDKNVLYSNDQLCDKISVNLVKYSLRLALLYLTNRSSNKCENWCGGKA